jgi:hypothetical protein
MVLGFERKLLAVWALLVGVTLLSWLIGANHGHGAFVRTPAITVGVLLIAALKARIIIRRFMEANDAPALLRRLTDGWLLLAMGMLLLVYGMGLGVTI